jgi:DNA mismatch endonuclease (patch repair protein)
MSRIKGKNTKPEMLIRRFLFKNGFRYRLHVRNLPGKPDLVLAKYKIAIFVHGCFWHGHKDCKYFVVPKTRTEWWLNKITRNISLDEKNKAELALLNWEVIEIWECELKKNNLETTLSILLNKLKMNSSYVGKQ